MIILSGQSSKFYSSDILHKTGSITLKIKEGLEALNQYDFYLDEFFFFVFV